METTGIRKRMKAEIRTLGLEDAALLRNVEAGVFDGPVDPVLSAEFLADPRHHIAVAVIDGRVVGFASAVDYVHPDKPPELWINEVSVAPAHRGQGLASRVIAALCDAGREIGCREAWVLTELDNEPARRLYESAGGRVASRSTVMYALDLGIAGEEP